MKKFAKPTYIPEEFLEATNSGWVDKRTGEILVAMTGLLDKLKAEEIVHLPVVIKEDIDKDIEKIVNEEVPEKVETVEVETETKSEEVIEEPTEEVKTEEVKVEEPKTEVVKQPSKRGRKPKNTA